MLDRPSIDDRVVGAIEVLDQPGRAVQPADVSLIGAGALQLATPSVAEALGIRYMFAAYCADVVPCSRASRRSCTTAGPAR
jgi:hypothetical protein